MTFRQHTVDSYEIVYSSDRFAANEAPLICLVTCFENVSGTATQLAGRLAFFEDTFNLPTNQLLPAVVGGPAEPHINFHLRELNDVLTILREEKPLQITLDTDRGLGTLRTKEKEPVGEQEGV